VGLTYVTSSISGGISNDDSSPSGSGLTWDISLLAGATSAPLTYQVTVDKGSSSYITRDITAQLNSSTPVDTIPGNDSDTVTINIIDFDASVTQVVSDSTPEEGQTVTFTLTVLNTTADSTGTNVIIRDIVPAGFTYVGGSITGGTSRDASSPTGTGLEWTIASLGPSASEDLTFQATVNAGAKASDGPTIDNTGSLFSSDQQDSNATNDSDTQTLSILGLDLLATKTVNVNNPIEGDQVTYTIAIQNTSSQTATNIIVRDIVPSGVTYSSGSIGGGTSTNDSTPSSGTDLQ
jgi:uncharacterized repeat protein (TIGR01451 family)